MIFYVGLHQPSDAAHFERACVSITRLRHRKGPFPARQWIMDSGAFMEISTHGSYRHSVEAYATEIRRWADCGELEAAVAQDWMCEPWIVRKTGLTIEEHQRRTIQRYDELLECGLPVYVMPVLQGFLPSDYATHLRMYRNRLPPASWVGVGSVCKRNGSPRDVAAVLAAIKRGRPDLRLHGFGLKTTAIADATVRGLLHSADSMAWSYSARKQGRNGNDWREARRMVDQVEDAAARVGAEQLHFDLAAECVA